MEELLPIANAASTWFMVGVIWLVQIAVYPSFRRLDPARFSEAMLDHQRRLERVVIVPMLIELVTSLALLALHPESVLAWLGCLCVGVWGFSTVLIQVPAHNRLAAKGYDAQAIGSLVKWNWPRKIAWTAHGAICAAILVRVSG